MYNWIKNALPVNLLKTPATILNIKNIKYNPLDETHRQYIEEEVNLFKQNYKKLRNTDRVVGVGAGIDTLLFFARLVGPGLSFVGYVGLLLYATQIAMRQNLYTEHQNRLEKMVEIYNWCIKSNNQRLSYDDSFLNVLDTIAPFVETETLMLKNFHSDVSYHFVETLSKAPHKIQFVMMKSHGLEDNTEATQSTGKKNRWVGLFDLTLSEANRALYGYNTKEENQRLVGRSSR